MPRGLKLGIGIPLVVLGFVVTLAGVAAAAVFGLDGTYRIASGIDTTGHAVVFDGLSLGRLPRGGAWSAQLGIEVDPDEGTPVFVGVGPRDEVEAYLGDAIVDRIVQLRPVGGLQTERVEPDGATHDPAPPATETFWAATDEGTPARLMWTATAGKWSVVVMRADGRPGLHADGELGVRIDAIGPTGVALLVVGVLLLGGGGALTISGAKMPRSRPAPARPDHAPAPV